MHFQVRATCILCHFLNKIQKLIKNIYIFRRGWKKLRKYAPQAVSNKSHQESVNGRELREGYHFFFKHIWIVSLLKLHNLAFYF